MSFLTFTPFFFSVWTSPKSSPTLPHGPPNLFLSLPTENTDTHHHPEITHIRHVFHLSSATITATSICPTSKPWVAISGETHGPLANSDGSCLNSGSLVRFYLIKLLCVINWIIKVLDLFVVLYWSWIVFACYWTGILFLFLSFLQL